MIRPMLLCGAACAALLPVLPAAAAAQTTDELVVTASRIERPAESLPYAADVIGRETLDIQATLSDGLVDAIGRFAPSFSPSRQKLSGAGETFRGRSPLYLIDGVPQSNPLRDGSRDGFTIDPSVIDRVEIIYGANALQGVGATGGVINYVTISPPETGEWESKLSASITADDGFQGDGYGYRGTASAGLDTGAVDLLVSAAAQTRGAFYDADGRRIGVDNTQGDIQDSQALNLFAKLGWEPDAKTRIQLMANLYDLDGDGDYVAVPGDALNGVPTSAMRGTFPGEPVNNKVKTLSLDIHREAVLGGEITLQAYYQDFAAVYGGGIFGTFQDPAIDAGGTLFDQSANNSEKLGLRGSWLTENLPIEGLRMVVGTDFLRDKTYQELVQTHRIWVPETKFISIAPFVQLEQDLGRLRLSGGARYEIAELKVDDFQTLASYGAPQVEGGAPSFEELILNAGASFDLTDSLTLFGSFSEGFTMADVGRILRGVDQPGQSVEGLLNLEPVLADNLEAGVNYKAGRFDGRISVFRSQSDLGQRLQAGPDGIFSVKRERTEIQGLEASLDVTATDRVNLGGSFAILEGEYDSNGDDETDTDLGGSNISPARLNLYVQGQVTPAILLRAQTSTLFDREFGNSNPLDDFDGYTLLDLFARWDTGQSGAFELGLRNALDEDYITYYSQTVRPTDDLGYYAGRGRTVTLRWSKTF